MREQLVRTCDRGPGGIDLEHLPSKARSAFARNSTVNLILHGEVPRHTLWAFPFISQELRRKDNNASMTT